ncbi:MAG: glucose-6-phosphate dehydrogenase assembly protein OpcA [Actinomycetales bacterium]|nr:glucose-6-phosphate dehydrogenase assembly protein OpcA [Actinomycetales bacterium]
MIVDLPRTTTGEINRRLVELRDTGGAIALGRVMTLVIVTPEHLVERAVEAANAASREHPCRVLPVVPGDPEAEPALDAQIRVGGDAGASEVVVLRLRGPLAGHGDSVVVPLLLPDAPVVAWWPGQAPTVPAEDPIGAMAQRRITDAANCDTPVGELQRRAERYVPGDTDLTWTRITRWRAVLAAALDEPPDDPVTAVTVTGGSDSASADLLAAWLGSALACPVTRERSEPGTGVLEVVLERASGPVSLLRPNGEDVALLVQPGQPPRRIALAPRQDRDCLAEELRRMDPDEVYGEVLTQGLPLVTGGRPPEPGGCG